MQDLGMLIVFILSIVLGYVIINRGCCFLDTLSLENSKPNKMAQEKNPCYNPLIEKAFVVDEEESEEENQYENTTERTHFDLPVFFTFEYEDHSDSRRDGKGISGYTDSFIRGNAGLSLYAAGGPETAAKKY